MVAIDLAASKKKFHASTAACKAAKAAVLAALPGSTTETLWKARADAGREARK